MASAKVNLSQDASPSIPPPYCPQEDTGVTIYQQVPSANMLQPPTMMIVAPLPPVGPRSTRLRCPSCHADIKTRLETKASTKTHLIALLLCSVGCLLCFCIPYCKDSCQNAEHYCPSCGAYVGSYSN